MKFTSDIDIDFADRDKALSLFAHVPAAIRRKNEIKKHNTGVYVTDIPYDPVHDLAALDYEQAESRGYVKLDFLNVWVYQWVRDDQHLQELMREPNWSRLMDRAYFERLIHLKNHYNAMRQMPEPIDSIPRLAMFLSVIRPAKKHLIGKTWSEVAQTVWQKPDDGGYYFKRSHAVAYAHLVAVHMNLLVENIRASSSPE